MNRIYIMAIALCFSGSALAQTHLSLEQSKTLALSNNVKIKNSGLELKAAQEMKKEAYTNYFPKVSASAMGMQAVNPLLKMNMKGGNLPVYDGNPANLATATQFAYMPDVNMGMLNQMGLGYVNVLQPIYAGGKIKTANKLTDLNIEVKEKLQKMSADEIVLRTEQHYWLVISVQEKQKMLNSYIQFLDTLYHQAYNAYKNGVIIKNDLLKVSIKQSELQLSKIQLENGKKLALMQFCQTIGVEYSSDLVLDDKLENLFNPQNLFVHNSEVLSSRMEFQLVEKAVEASKLETQMVQGNYMPTVGVGLTGYYLNQFESGVKGAANGMVYASLSIPISDWWGGKHKLSQMKVKEDIAKNTLKDSKELLHLQMEKAWTDLNEAYTKITLTEETLKQTDENLKVNQDSYNNGLISLSDLLEARALKADTEDKLIEAKIQYKVAVSSYMQVTAR